MSQKQFEQYREKYPVFEYRSFDSHIENDTLLVQYHFVIPGLAEFSPRWEFPLSAGNRRAEGIAEYDPILQRLLFSLGMVETISYYKTVCPRTISVQCGSLNKWQQKWWKHLYHDGLGEFLYLNGITVSEEELLQIEGGAARTKPLEDERKYEGILVPVGGGKDSVVSLELLKEEPLITYVINGNATTANVIELCDHKKGEYVAKRVLDKKLLELNAQGYLNGHTPFSAIVAFSSVITAYLLGLSRVALSNESSANESTVPGSFVNHQYSKSYEFESDFMEYFRTLTDSGIRYFSMLRPLTELQIAALFAGDRKYHKVFRSCNRGSKQGIWCCDCPKCLFVYIILSPFLSEEELQGIFGEKLLDKESLDRDFRELCGIDENKPFECVGTRREVEACLAAYIARGGHSLLTDRYAREIQSFADPGAVDRILGEWCEEHGVPEQYCSLIRRELEKVPKQKA